MVHRIRALDPLFFRDGRPFTMGDDTMAAGIFPPYPGVLYGALRAAKACKLGIPVTEIEPRTSGLRITDIRLYREEDNVHYFPTPLDLVATDEENTKTGRLLELKKVPQRICTNSVFKDFLLMAPSAEKVDSAEGTLINKSLLEAYLDIGTASEYRYELRNPTKEQFFMEEAKIGLARDTYRKNAREGYLYRISMSRLQGIHFDIETNLQPGETTSLIKLGGEARQAVLFSLPTATTDRYPLAYTRPKAKNWFKIYLATPALFRNGYFPDLKTLFSRNDLEIKAAVVGKKQHIGGFDMRQGMPKSMLKAVPAGSVYYCFANEGIGDLTNLPASISEFRAEEGFGLYHIGAVHQMRENSTT